MPIEIVSFAHSLASSLHFEMVDPADLEMVLSDSDEPIELRFVEPSADEPLIRSGSTFTHLLFAQRGVIVPWQYPYSELKAPFLIGDHEFLTGAERWVANYSAVTNAMVADIPRAVMERILARIPGVRDHVHELVMARLARFYWTSLAISGTPVSRVAAALVSRLALEGDDYGEDKKIRIAQSDLARLTAMSRFGAADGLKKLRDDKKAITFGIRFAGEVCVPDVERLKNEAFAEVRDQAIRPLLLRSDGDGQPLSILSATGSPMRPETSEVAMEQPHAPARSRGSTSEQGQCGEDARLFDRYVAVDWSASSRRARGPNSIWIAVCGAGGPVELVNPGTRQEAMNHIQMLLDMTTAAGGRLLCGFDFPFGYPKGTAQMLAGREGWEAVWMRIAEIIIDEPDNSNNRFKAAAQLNQAFDGEGPFWGRHQSYNNSGLSPKRPQGDPGQNMLPRLRHAEKKVPRAQEVWKLWGPGSVGGQALTGIARLQELRRSRGDVLVWPFETLGEGRSHVLAEIYPSLIDPCPGNEVLDARQVKATALTMRELDRCGQLWQYLQAPNAMPPQVCREEGVILGMHDQPGFRAAAASNFM